MKPWDLIGWALISVVVGFVVAMPFTAVSRVAARYILHLRTRNTPPAEGQVWVQGGEYLRIKQIFEGRVILEHRSGLSTASWSDSPEAWRKRVMSRRLFLQKH